MSGRGNPKGKGAERDHQDGGEQGQRVAHVEHHNPGREFEPDCHGAEQYLGNQQENTEDRRGQDSAPSADPRLTPPEPSECRDRDDEHTDQYGGQAVPPFDHDLEVVERRNDPAVTEGPVVATPQPGTGNPHDGGKGDERERQDGGDGRKRP